MKTSILDGELVRKLQEKKIHKKLNQTIEAGTFIWDANFKYKKKKEMKERKEKNIPSKYMNKHTDFINEFYYKVKPMAFSFPTKNRYTNWST